MIYDKILEGKTVWMRSTDVEDASFILKIRNDEKKNKYVHAIKNDIDEEIEWIKKQRNHVGDYFFTILRKKDDEVLGNIAIYNIDESAQSGELGRWVSYGSSVENLETILITHDFGFSVLGLDKIYTKTLSDNKNVVGFWRRFGGEAKEKYIFDDESYYYNTVTVTEYNKVIRKNNSDLLLKVVDYDG